MESGKNLKAELTSATRQLVQPTGPTIIQQTRKSHKTIDTEDTDLKCSAQPDGTLVTEKIKTVQHEEILEDDLPEKDDNLDNGEHIEETVSICRIFKNVIVYKDQASWPKKISF